MKSIRYFIIALLVLGSCELYAPEGPVEVSEPVEFPEEGPVEHGDQGQGGQDQNPWHDSGTYSGSIDGSNSLMPVDRGSGLLPADRGQASLPGSASSLGGEDFPSVTPSVDPLSEDLPVDGGQSLEEFEKRADTDVAAVDALSGDQRSSGALSVANEEKMSAVATRLEDDLTEVDQHMQEMAKEQTVWEKIKGAFSRAKAAIRDFVKSVITSGKADKSTNALSEVDARLQDGSGDDADLLELFSDDGDVAAVPNEIAGSLKFLDGDIAESRSSATGSDTFTELADERDAAATKVDEYVQAADALKRTLQQSAPSDTRTAVAQKLEQQKTVLKSELANSLVRDIQDPYDASRKKRLDALRGKDPKTLTPLEHSEIVTLERYDMNFKTAVDALEGVQKLSEMTLQQKAAVQAFGNKVITVSDVATNFDKKASSAQVDYAGKSIGQGKRFRDLPREVQGMYLNSIGSVHPDAAVANLLEPLVQRAETHSFMQDALNGKDVAPLSADVQGKLNAAQSAYQKAVTP